MVPMYSSAGREVVSAGRVAIGTVVEGTVVGVVGIVVGAVVAESGVDEVGTELPESGVVHPVKMDTDKRSAKREHAPDRNEKLCLS